ncbi:MAG: hypothetical protein ACXVBV_19475 [Isosphaeraceae bacterium]
MSITATRWWLMALGECCWPSAWSLPHTHVYESTAAYGGTIFWKYNADFLKATGNKEYK